MRVTRQFRHIVSSRYFSRSLFLAFAIHRGRLFLPLLLHLEALHIRNAWAYSSPRGAWRHRERIRDPARLYGAWLLTVTVEDDRQGNLIASVNQEELAACVFRNTYTKPEEPAKPSTPTPPTKFIPQTGDPIESAPIVVSAVLSVAILAVALVVNKRGKRN